MRTDGNLIKWDHAEGGPCISNEDTVICESFVRIGVNFVNQVLF